MAGRDRVFHHRVSEGPPKFPSGHATGAVWAAAGGFVDAGGETTQGAYSHTGGTAGLRRESASAGDIDYRSGRTDSRAADGNTQAAHGRSAEGIGKVQRQGSGRESVEGPSACVYSATGKRARPDRSGAGLHAR